MDLSQVLSKPIIVIQTSENVTKLIGALLRYRTPCSFLQIQPKWKQVLTCTFPSYAYHVHASSVCDSAFTSIQVIHSSDSTITSLRQNPTHQPCTEPILFELFRKSEAYLDRSLFLCTYSLIWYLVFPEMIKFLIRIACWISSYAAIYVQTASITDEARGLCR